MQELESRPPYVQFELRPVEDREATAEVGHMQYKDVIYAMVTPAGSKDVFEDEAENWLAKQEKHVRDGRTPIEHMEYYRKAFERFKQGLEEPESGTPIRSWGLLTPAQHKQVLEANVRTVEDLAAANEPTLLQIGIGARAMKDKAEAYLQSADMGKAATAIQDLKLKLEESEAARERQAQQMRALSEKVEAMESGKDEEKRGPGRPKGSKNK